MRAVAATAGMLGGLCWVGARWVDVLALAGAVLLAVAVLGAGAGVVSRSAVWLRVLVAVCLLVLVGSVLEVLRDNADQEVVLAAAGGAAVLVALVALAQRRPAPASRSRGTHAA